MKTRIRKGKGPVLATREDLERCIGELARLTIDRMGIEAALNDELKAVRDRYQATLGMLEQDCDTEFRLLKEWAEAHPEEFAERKSMDLTHGTIGFRTGTPAVRMLKGWTETMVLAVLDMKAEWRERYIRKVVELNKQALIEDREGLGADRINAFGLKIAQSETFFVEPKIEPKA